MKFTTTLATIAVLAATVSASYVPDIHARQSEIPLDPSVTDVVSVTDTVISGSDTFSTTSGSVFLPTVSGSVSGSASVTRPIASNPTLSVPTASSTVSDENPSGTPSGAATHLRVGGALVGAVAAFVVVFA